MLITSRQNPRVKSAVKLRDRRQRDKQGRILIDGAREIRRALAASVVLDEIFLCPTLTGSPEREALEQELPASGAEVLSVTAEVFEKLAYGERCDGVVAVAHAPQRSLADLVLPPAAIVGVIEGVEKPGNVGAVLRSADGAGLAALIVAAAGTDLYNPNTIRASLGTIFQFPVCTATPEETLIWLRTQGLPIFAARLERAVDYAEADFRHGGAIVLGSEARGLSSLWEAPEITGVRLPMRGIADSLNISAAAAVLFYEALRQQRTRGS